MKLTGYGITVQGSVLLHQGGDGEGGETRCGGAARTGVGGRVPRAGHEDWGGRITSGVHGGRRSALRHQQGEFSEENISSFILHL